MSIATSSEDSQIDSILPSPGLLPDGSPETAVAGLPTTLIVISLENQLFNDKTFRNVDYLDPILRAAALLRERHAEEPSVIQALRTSIDHILNRVVKSIETSWEVSLQEIGLDPGSVGYESDVLELYRFFVVERVRYGRELLLHVLQSTRRRLADRYRRDVEKRNQTVAEARRVLARFEDVVIYVSMPQILEDLRAETSWGFSFADALGMLNADTTSFLDHIAPMWNDSDFAARYCEPALSLDTMTTQITLQQQWLEFAPKKDDADVSAEGGE